MAAQLQGSAFLEKGQALLVIVLVMVVTLTVGLSLATRSITNSRVSTEEENSQRAFSAAEAGIEELLKTDTPTQKTDSTLNTSYTAIVAPRDPRNVLLNGGSIVPRDEGADLWLSVPNFTGPSAPTYSGQIAGTFTVYWEDNDGCASTTKPTPAVEVVVLYGNTKETPSAKHFVFDSCGPGVGTRRDSNKFSAPTGGAQTVLSVPFSHSGSFTLLPGELGFVARIIPLYGSSKIAVSANRDMPPQGKQIQSTGTSGGTARKISVFRSYPKLPIELFAYSIFSP